MSLDELLETYPPRVSAAFREAIETIKSHIILKTIVERLERGDIYGAVQAVQFEPEAFAGLELALREAFNAGGVSMVQSLPAVVSPEGTRVLWQFGVRNLEAERLIREQLVTLVTNITGDQQEALRIAFQTGLAAGKNPTSTALDVAGRVNRITGRREGGSIGLTSRQVEFIYGETGARANLLSGDPELMKRYLDLKTRDKRFDRTVAKAIREGRPVETEMVAKIVGRLNDNNLKLRAETIGLEETKRALFTVRDNAIRQQIDAGKVMAQEITKHWKHSASENPRMQHIEMAARYKAEGVPLDQPFIAPDGTTLMYPHDPSAPARHTLGCKCRMEYEIDYAAAGLRRYRARTA
ncbi:head morphogenesis protein [Neorhizobium lilium]|uniref:Head morphogenesis protein n=1 Tax=Neorhizobium lilium TaxID=2503024 RepID=A0A444LH26_9HYPH|nr:head morphogenesis protein [Neorhizobium lilium]RWX78265.1 head morphogenesis protein [Neorhizobium lilium]